MQLSVDICNYIHLEDQQHPLQIWFCSFNLD